MLPHVLTFSHGYSGCNADLATGSPDLVRRDLQRILWNSFEAARKPDLLKFNLMSACRHLLVIPCEHALEYHGHFLEEGGRANLVSSAVRVHAAHLACGPRARLQLQRTLGFPSSQAA